MLRAGLKFLIKDVLRGARFTMRKSASPRAIDLPGRSHLTRMADTVLSSLEETVVSLRYGSDHADDMIRVALAEYPRLQSLVLKPGFDSKFASVTYRLARGMLARHGIETVFASELGFAQAARILIGRACDRDTLWPAHRFGAEVALALIAAAPIRGTPSASTRNNVFLTDTNPALAYTLGLVVTAWLTKGDGIGAIDCADSAGEIVGAAFERMAATRQAPEPATALAAIYAELAAFVP